MLSPERLSASEKARLPTGHAGTTWRRRGRERTGDQPRRSRELRSEALRRETGRGSTMVSQRARGHLGAPCGAPIASGTRCGAPQSPRAARAGCAARRARRRHPRHLTPSSQSACCARRLGKPAGSGREGTATTRRGGRWPTGRRAGRWIRGRGRRQPGSVNDRGTLE